MTKPILSTHNLYIASSQKTILHNISLTILPGQIHAIIGPNGAGKSTLAAALAGKPTYTITKGKAFFLDKNLLELNPQERATQGIFLAFQNPASLPGVPIINFLKAAINAIHLAHNLPPLSPLAIIQRVKKKITQLGIAPSTLHKPLNENFSGGEKKLNELLQMAVLNPKLAILDEIDSGLDLDKRRLVWQAIQRIRTKKNAFMIISHYIEDMLKYITPDRVWVLHQGRIIQSGNANLAHQILKTGYQNMPKPS